jgi:hypothetical protein
MRKERNNFFQESGYNQGYYFNNNMMPQMPQMEASSSFYMNQNMNQAPSMYSDFQTRLSRLERQVNRLETRINKIESNLPLVNQSDEIENNTNMYMI